MLYLTSSVHNPHLTVIFYYSNQGYLGKKKKNYKKIKQQKMEESFGLQYQDLILVSESVLTNTKTRFWSYTKQY